MPMAIPLIASKRAPIFRIMRGPICTPSFAKIGHFSQASLSFVKSHSIMDEAVPAFFGGKPLFVSANLQ